MALFTQDKRSKGFFTPRGCFPVSRVTYAGFDWFGRVVDQKWANGAGVIDSFGCCGPGAP
jgi:hypothetical protein